jgi:hypothetical protein
MNHPQKVGYVMHVAHNMQQSFLASVGDQPGPELAEMVNEDGKPNPTLQNMANLVEACSTSKGFRRVLEKATQGNFANRPEEMQALLLVVTARLGWLDVKLETEIQGST